MAYKGGSFFGLLETRPLKDQGPATGVRARKRPQPPSLFTELNAFGWIPPPFRHACMRTECMTPLSLRQSDEKRVYVSSV